MTQASKAYSICRSVFHEGTEASATEAYTQLWITLINQMEKGKQALSAVH